MKRGLLITTGLCLVLVGGYFALSKLAIRHATQTCSTPLAIDP